MIDTDKYEEKLEHRMNKEFCNYISSGDMQKELAIQYAHEFYVNALDLLAEVKRLRELFSIDEGSRDEGYCITMRLEGCEYIGTLRLYKDEEGKVIE